MLFYFLRRFFDNAVLSLACEEHVQDLLREGTTLSASVVLAKHFFTMYVVYPKEVNQRGLLCEFARNY